MRVYSRYQIVDGQTVYVLNQKREVCSVRRRSKSNKLYHDAEAVYIYIHVHRKRSSFFSMTRVPREGHKVLSSCQVWHNASRNDYAQVLCL